MWKTIPGYEGRYEASTSGRIRSLVGRGSGGQPTLLKNSIGNHGYPVVNIAKAGEASAPKLVHRLVLLAFVGECPEGLQVRHLDGVRANAARRNLQYGTQLENEADKANHGTAPPPEGYTAKLTKDEVAAIRFLLTAGFTLGELAHVFKVSKQNLCDIKAVRSWPTILPHTKRTALRIFHERSKKCHTLPR